MGLGWGGKIVKVPLGLTLKERPRSRRAGVGVLDWGQEEWMWEQFLHWEAMTMACA